MLKAGGTTSVLDATVFIVVFAYNLIDQIIKNQSIIERLSYTLPFIAFSVIVYISKNKYISATIYYLIACGIIIGLPNYSDFSSAIFFIYSFHIIKTNWCFILNLSTTYLLLSIRLILNQDSIPSTMLMMFVFSYIYLIYYFLIYKPTILPKRRIDLWKEISEKEKAILKLYMRGYDYAKISKTLNIKDKKESIRTTITRVRVKSGCENDIQFGIWLSEIG